MTNFFSLSSVSILVAFSLTGCEFDEFMSEPNVGYGAPYGSGSGAGYGPGGYNSGYGGSGYAPQPPPYSGYGGGYGSGYGGGYRGGYPPPQTYSNIRIIAARWESERRGADVTGVLQSMIDRGASTIRADNATFGVDPDKGKHKRLYVKYRDRGETRTAFANEGESIRLK